MILLNYSNGFRVLNCIFCFKLIKELHTIFHLDDTNQKQNIVRMVKSSNDFPLSKFVSITFMISIMAADVI